MDAYKIDLRNYKVKSLIDGRVEDVDYEVKEVIANIICHPVHKHTGYKFYQVLKVADKIATCKEDHIILDTSEYTIVKEAFDRFDGFGRSDGEMVRRIYEAEKIVI